MLAGQVTVGQSLRIGCVWKLGFVSHMGKYLTFVVDQLAIQMSQISSPCVIPSVMYIYLLFSAVQILYTNQCTLIEQSVCLLTTKYPKNCKWI